MIKVGIIGGAGYTGGELLRILINHPNVHIQFINSKSSAGNKISSIHDDILGSDLIFSDKLIDDVDVIFTCSGHGQAIQYLNEVNIPNHIKIIDLGNDFRLNKDSKIGKRIFNYGLPELQREVIQQSGNIANPGCFATAIQLGLLPLAALGEVNDVFTTGITGSTGAGQSLSSTGHFSWRSNNIQAYKTLTHQHIGEIHQSLLQLQKNDTPNVNFVPWRGDFSRGIFISSQVKTKRSLDELYDIYTDYYQNHPFTFVMKSAIHLKQVVNTNNAVIQLELNEDNLVIHSAIDNLLKGASGQAVQNMNLLFGLDETTGLKLKANSF